MQETLKDNDTSVPFNVVTLGLHIVLPVSITCPLYFPESHRQSEISSFSKVISVLGKARSFRVPNLGCWGVESPGRFDVSQKKTLHQM